MYIEEGILRERGVALGLCGEQDDLTDFLSLYENNTDGEDLQV